MTHHDCFDCVTPIYVCVCVCVQGVHSPYVDPPAWEGVSAPNFWDQTFADMLHVVDSGIGNFTSTLKTQGMWDDALLIITADNGGNVDPYLLSLLAPHSSVYKYILYFKEFHSTLC